MVAKKIRPALLWLAAAGPFAVRQARRALGFHQNPDRALLFRHNLGADGRREVIEAAVCPGAGLGATCSLHRLTRLCRPRPRWAQSRRSCKELPHTRDEKVWRFQPALLA